MLDNWSVAWTRKVEINNAREIGEIFDAISYRKGASEGEGSSTVLVDFQENPKAAQEHTKNPGVMDKIQKLISAGIVQMK
ncbi:unnamed protein product [Trifolium pratense]|uniref:Uncharacterized protein n=1 Tax=Trifolium pratense TaxID=57577 RepID=A0ACB0K443_TRIPR|nr:unnamed protein product [Trifolium pratense]